jgi:hypothetical protein
MKILNRAEDMEKENKRPRTPEKLLQDEAPSSTVPEYTPRTPEYAPPPAEDKPQYSPAWCDPIRPLDILGGQYPDPESYDFKITKSLRANDNLDIYYVGISHGYNARPFGFNLQSPPCNVRFIPSKYDQSESRVFLAPKAPDGFFTAYPSEYLAFIDHVEGVAMRLKREMTEMGLDTTTWKLPMKFEEGICQGIYAKVKNADVRNVLKDRSNHVRVTLKLSCIFFSADNCGLSFEITNAL